MTAKEKIENLTNSWYGFAVVAAAFSLLQNGIGFFSIASAVFSLFVSFFITWFIGRRLVNKSSLTRLILIVVSGVATALGAFGTAKVAWMFLNEWSLSLLVSTAIGGAYVYMNGRSFRVLTDAQVKAYFG